MSQIYEDTNRDLRMSLRAEHPMFGMVDYDEQQEQKEQKNTKPKSLVT